MTKRRAANPEKKICDAALKCAATRGWSSLTHDMIAKTAKLPAAQVRKFFPSIDAVLTAIIHQTDIQVMAAAGKSMRGPVHDRLFEIMMARFDILQSHHAAIMNIMAEARRNPNLMKYIFPAQLKSMQKTLALAGLKQDGAKDLLATGGLYAVYSAVFCTWLRDNTDDMSKTMAALDRHLRRAERIGDILFRAF